ncbi:zinc finger protein 878 [Anabrus simplex]|uniref:zinc finger protein 878 n=1 Tax=Anabrus simplex TaxID=316456 RepID=UPI0035A39F67
MCLYTNTKNKEGVTGVPFTNMAECYDEEVEHTEEPCASTSDLPFGYGKTRASPTPVAMFYPQLSGYEVHPLILNPRRKGMPEKIKSENALTDSEPDVALGLSSPIHKDLMIQNYRQRDSHSPSRRVDSNTDQVGELPVMSGKSCHGETEVSDYSSKSRKSFFCRACGKAFKFQTSLLRHNNKVHISKYQCPTCSRVFSRQAYLDVHTSKQGTSCYLGSSYSSPTISHSLNSDLSSHIPGMK